MGLKGFHIFFIVASIALADFFAFWALQQFRATSERVFIIGVVFGIVASISLLIYLGWFFKKMKSQKVFLFALLLPALSQACPVCIGNPDSPLVKSANLGTMVLLMITLGVLGGFLTTFIVWARRARKLPQS